MTSGSYVKESIVNSVEGKLQIPLSLISHANLKIVLHLSDFMKPSMSVL